MSNNSFYNDLKKIERNKKSANKFSSLFFFYIIPFIIINFIIFLIATSIPKADIELHLNDNHTDVEIKLIKSSFFPIKKIEAFFENEKLELEKIDSKTYIATVNKNGNIEITIENLNGMSKKFFDYVHLIDDTPPLIDGIIENKKVFVNFSDEDSGIDYDSIKAFNFDGKEISALEIDKEHNLAIFNFKNTLSIDVHIKDILGNEVVATFSNIEN